MPSAETHPPAAPAIVARAADRASDRYLKLSMIGAPIWVAHTAYATAFPSMREATRMATRLPSGLRAFGLPRDPELALSRAH